MKNNNVAQLCTLMLLFLAYNINAQDTYFSQWQNSKTFINPAFAGKDTGIYINTAYRNQWPGLTGNFVTYFASADTYIKKIKTGIGFNYVDDIAGQGAIKSKRYSIQLAPKFTIKNKLRISLGLEASYVKLELDPLRFSVSDMLQTRYSFLMQQNPTTLFDTKKKYFDYNSSILLENKLGNIGFVYSHIFQPNQSFYKLSNSPLPSLFTIHATSKQFSLSATKPLKMKIGFIAMRQATSSFSMLSATTSYKAFEVLTGFSRRAIVVGAGIQKKHFRFSYSYDINISKPRNSQGSHELNMAYRFGKR